MQVYKRQHYYLYRVYTSAMHRLRRRTTKASWLAVIGVIFTVSLGLDTTLSVAYQVFTLLFCLLVIATIASFFCRVKFSAKRLLPQFGAVGEPMHYTIEITNRSRRIQRNVGVIDEQSDPRPQLRDFLEVAEPGEEKRNFYDRMNGWYRWQWLTQQNIRANIEERVAPPLPPKVPVQISAGLVPTKRGYLRLTAVSLAFPDPFGFFRTLRRTEVEQSVLILPKRYQLRAISLPGNTKYQQGGVAMASSIGESEEFVALRDYRPGDPMRHIHWKSWAKAGKPIVKEFQDEFFVRHALVLDTFAPHVHSDIFEEAVSVAASFAYTIQTQDSLLDLLFVGPKAYCFTAGRGVAHTEQMLEILACVQICRSQTFAALQELVLEHSSNVSGCICVLLAWDQERQDFIKRLKIAGTPVKVLLIVPSGSKDQFNPGPMRDDPENFHVLEVDKIGQTLAAL